MLMPICAIMFPRPGRSLNKRTLFFPPSAKTRLKSKQSFRPFSPEILDMLGRLYLVLLFRACLCGANQPPNAQDRLISCLNSSKVPQALPGTPEFAISSSPHNIRLRFTPLAIALPTTVSHVQTAVACGRRLGVKVNARSGGHNYGSHGIGGEDGHLVVDLRNMNTTSVNSATKLATVAPGARLGNMAIALDAQGKRAIPHGICPK